MQQTEKSEKFISGTVQNFKYRQQHMITHILVLQAARDLREQNFWQATNQVCDLVKNMVIHVFHILILGLFFYMRLMTCRSFEMTLQLEVMVNNHQCKGFITVSLICTFKSTEVFSLKQGRYFNSASHENTYTVSVSIKMNGFNLTSIQMFQTLHEILNIRWF